MRSFGGRPTPFDELSYPGKAARCLGLLIGVVMLAVIVTLPFVGVGVALTGEPVEGVSMAVLGLSLWLMISIANRL